jgi:hypothetical protein
MFRKSLSSQFLIPFTIIVNSMSGVDVGSVAGTCTDMLLLRSGLRWRKDVSKTSTKLSRMTLKVETAYAS